ncbi:hypothetical protein [Agrococcus citreus]|uniref:DUF1963 domain-containing protein n=1 Tax=Agrococcus citreus TaxID=84643 RepID=A0ABP4JPD8_9MICO
MAGPLRVERDVEVARWVQEALHDLDGTVASVVPPVFDAYARILHPATLSTPVAGAAPDEWGQLPLEDRELTWAEAATLIGDRLGERQPHTAWLSRFGERGHDLPDGGRMLDGHTLPKGGQIHEPHAGDVPLPLLSPLTELLLDEHGDAEVLAAVWEGSGLDPSGSAAFFFWPDDGLTSAERAQREAEAEAEARVARLASVDPEIRAAMERGDGLGLPRDGQGRDHVLLRGRLSALRDPRWVETAGLGWRQDWPDPGRTPNLLWPAAPHATPAWMVATDLDLDVTLVGGSGHFIGRVLGHPSLEAERVRPGDPLV